MRMSLSVAGFGFVVLVALATAQTTQQPQAPPANSGTPPTRIGDSATMPSPAAGSTASSSGQVPDAQSSSSNMSAVADSELESQIQTALSKEPTLTGDSARVTVSGDTVELAGAVGTSKEKITATRIVQSFAGSKKLVNRLTVTGKNEKAPPRAGTAETSDRNRQPAAENPGNTTDADQGSPPSTSKPPQSWRK